ncbi:unnamed protein product [Paramecium octaurelia]|uniref:Uncharacterized protein n=1 Tax=Paramecium octaurelia TaxID=43137 RepID=A0A8S1SUL5_PAROT|nr:unnamed protein product [Paramecium octaurelia]
MKESLRKQKVDENQIIRLKNINGQMHYKIGVKARTSILELEETIF